MSRKLRGRTIALDFDGVLHQYAGYKGGAIAGPIAGSLDAIVRLQAMGATIVIFSTRPRDMIAAWLREHGFPELEITNIKKPFFVIVDDRAVTFNGEWSEDLLAQITRFKPYWWQR